MPLISLSAVEGSKLTGFFNFSLVMTGSVCVCVLFVCVCERERQRYRVCVWRNGGTAGSGEDGAWETVNGVIFAGDAGVRRAA